MSFEKSFTDEKSDIFGSLFQLSVEFGYDSCAFVSSVMSNPKLEGLVYNDECTEWCDERFLMSALEKINPFTKGITCEGYVMWFLGYLYKYWMRKYNILPKEIFKILPFNLFMKRYEFYHTQGWDYIIEDAIKSYKRQ